MDAITREATRDDLGRLWPAISAAHLFRDAAALRSYVEEGPWRLRVAASGEAALLGRWREHLDILAVRGLWCPERRVPVLLEELRRVAREHDYARLLGPLVPEEAVGPYVAAGLEVTQRIVVCRLVLRQAPEAVMPDGVEMREGTAGDAAQVLRVDRGCFDDFWRYDPGTLKAYIESERLALAVSSGRVIGYTLSTAHAGEATVARLAVEKSHRGRGIGTALLREALGHASAAGARAVTLSTQEDNTVSRRLYRREGFRESPGRLVGTMTPEGRL